MVKACNVGLPLLLHYYLVRFAPFCLHVTGVQETHGVQHRGWSRTQEESSRLGSVCCETRSGNRCRFSSVGMVQDNNGNMTFACLLQMSCVSEALLLDVCHVALGWIACRFQILVRVTV